MYIICRDIYIYIERERCIHIYIEREIDHSYCLHMLTACGIVRSMVTMEMGSPAPGLIYIYIERESVCVYIIDNRCIYAHI